MGLSHTTPILRSFDEDRAKDFYADFLGFSVDWEHRFEDGLPLYMQISRDDCILHISEHNGDCCPGSAVRIQVDDIHAFHASLPKDYKYARPGIQKMPWGTEEVSITDPFGNRLTFTPKVG